MNENRHIISFINKFGAIFTLLFFVPTLIYGLDITLEWDENTESDLAGYKLYYKIGSSGPPYDGEDLIYNETEVPSPIDVGNTTQITISIPDSILSSQGNFYFVVTAYDNETPPLESGYSNEVSVIKGDVNGDGKIDSGDAILILRYASGLISLNEREKWCGNVTNKPNNDDIDSDDALKILQYSAGLITTLY